MAESVNASNNQEASVANSYIFQTLKAIQAQMGLFAKSLQNYLKLEPLEDQK